MTDAGGPSRGESALQEAQRLTRLLRESELPRWRNLRTKLEEEGIGLRDAAMGYMGPHDYMKDLALLVTRDGSLYWLTFEWGYDEEGEDMADYDRAWIWDWQQLGKENIGSQEAEAAAAAKTLFD